MGTRPVTPIEEILCQFCGPGSLTSPHSSCSWAVASSQPAKPDTEFHFLVQCPMFAAERVCLFKRIKTINPNFATLPPVDQFKTLLCPISATSIKLVNRFIKNMFDKRD